MLGMIQLASLTLVTTVLAGDSVPCGLEHRPLPATVSLLSERIINRKNAGSWTSLKLTVPGCTPTGAIIRPRTGRCSSNEDVEPSLDCTFSKHTNIHHDLPDVSDTIDRLPSEESLRGILEASETLSHMSTPESIITGAGQPSGQHFLLERDQKLVGFVVRKEASAQLGDMQARITNAQTPASKQEPDVLAPSKRRKLVYLADGFQSNIRRHESDPKAEILNLEACEDSGLTAEQHTSADRESSKSSTLEDIDSAAHVSPCRSISLAPPQCLLEKQVLDENVEQQLSEGRPIHNLNLSLVQNVSNSQHSTSQNFVPSAGRTWMDSQDIELIKDPETPRKAQTMASGSRDKWLQLSLRTSPQSDESPGDGAPVRVPQISPMQIPTSVITSAPSTLQSSNALVDFFNSRGLQSKVDVSTPDTDVHKMAGPSSSTHISVGNLEFQFLSPSPILQEGYAPARFSTSPQIHLARIFQSVKSRQTETTSDHASRGRQVVDAGAHPWKQSQVHDSPRTPPNSIDAVNITTLTPTTEIRDWKSLPSSTAAESVAQGVDNHEQAWRLLLQRVGSNWNGFAPSSSESSQRPAADPQEHLDPDLDALKRAVGRLQSPDQGPEGDSLPDLQLLQSSSMFPRYPLDPNIDVSVANCTWPRHGRKARRGPVSPSEFRQSRLLHPCAPRPGLWFTLQASSCPPEVSPLQQIPAVYVRVLQGWQYDSRSSDEIPDEQAGSLERRRGGAHLQRATFSTKHISVTSAGWHLASPEYYQHRSPGNAAVVV